ncbi:hypothetical protein [Micromonospora sp. CPCC 206061]|uniref:hypothetical protein n=1 Tax=Micromonospora sp. CPCC 206061 TaxID=3122410 RepID=UPI002FF01184
MLAELTTYAYAHPHPGWDGTGGGPGWWLVFPAAFWALVLATAGYLVYRRSPGRMARAAAERVLAERYARGEISADELGERRAGLRRRS